MPARHTEFDFGLTGLATQFHQDWTLSHATPMGVVSRYLAGDDAHGALALYDDARRLADSPVPTRVIETLWMAVTTWRDFPLVAGSDGRTWARAVAAASFDRLDQLGRRPPAELPPMVVTRVVSEAVQRELRAATPRLQARVRCHLMGDIPGLGAALRLTAAEVSPDLALRLFLRTVLEFGLPLSPDQYQRLRDLGDRLHYGAFVVSTVEFLVS